ncbi:cadherin repeat domain-containing protein, partial [Vibrio harveyi]|uniref:cadherin repeat domain-containing protein n=1 Tax=Vibrio harveyi TaxID=669 RepID=UPI001EFDE2AF
FTINLTDDTSESGISAVVDSDTDANTISETVGNGTEVQITGLATDADATDTVSYELTNDYNGAFEIDATTGVVTVKDSSKLDYETDNAPTITIKATSTDGSSSDATFTINLTDDTSESGISAVVDSDTDANT